MVEHERTGWVDAITWRISHVAMWLPAVILVIMTYEVFVRYFLDNGTYWANEASLWMAGMVYLFAGIYAMQQRSHIRIVLLYDVVPRNVRRLFDTMATLGIVTWCGAMIWGSYTEALTRFLRWERFGTYWDPPIPATMKPLILIAMILITIQAISNLIYDWNKEPEEFDIEDEVDINIEEIKRAQEALNKD